MCVPRRTSQAIYCLVSVRKREPSRKGTVRLAPIGVLKSGRLIHPGVGIRPCPTGRILDGTVPGNKLPGYDHSVPPGQMRSAPNRPVALSPIRRFASLRDKCAPRPIAPSPFRPFAVSLLPGTKAPRRRFAHSPFRFSRDKGAPSLIAPPPFRPFAVSLLLGREGQAYNGCAALVHGADSYVVHLV